MMVIKSAYERLFVAFYGWSLKVDGREGVYNVYYATLMLGLALMLNAAALLIALEVFFGWATIPAFRQSDLVWWITLSSIYFAIQFFYFYRNQRYRKLVARYAGSEEQLARVPRTRVFAYMATSLVIVLVLLYL